MSITLYAYIAFVFTTLKIVKKIFFTAVNFNLM